MNASSAPNSRAALGWLPLIPVLLLASAPQAHAAAWSQTLTTDVSWEDNLSNGYDSQYEVDGLTTGATWDVGARQSLTGDDTLLYGATAAGRVVWDVSDLDELQIGPRVAWEHKFGLGAYAPIVGLQAGFEGRIGGHTYRRGTGESVGIWWERRLTPELHLKLSGDYSNFNAKQAIFDLAGLEGTLALDYDFSESWQFSLAAGWRNGDVVSYAGAPGNFPMNLKGPSMMLDYFDDFGMPRQAYSVEARTIRGAVTAAYRMDSGYNLFFRYEYRDSSRDVLSYTNNTFSVAIARGF